MQDTLSALRGLQEIDRQIFRVESELKRLPAELAQRGGSLGEREQQIAEKRREAQVLRAQVKEIENMVGTLRARQRKLETESNGSTVDAALLASYQHEIRSVKRTVSDAEDDGLRHLQDAERLEGEAADLEASLEQDRPDFEAFGKNVEQELADAKARLESLKAERAKLTQDSIEPAHLELYRRLLELREGEAMAELVGGVCQGCFVSIPRNLSVRLARGLELVQCPSCTRILHQS